ncbi:MAG TPA: hypothetical protein VFZ03_06150 [Dongiaceae bacterium]
MSELENYGRFSQTLIDGDGVLAFVQNYSVSGAASATVFRVPTERRSVAPAASHARLMLGKAGGMTMANFEIETYKATTDLQRSGAGPTETRRTRTLELVSKPMYHGIVVKALIAFSSSFDAWNGSPVVGYYGDANPLAPTIAGWFPAAEFSAWLDLVRNERPIWLTYQFQAEGAINGYLSYLALATGPEPIGEGPTDVSYPIGIERRVLEAAINGRI